MICCMNLVLCVYFPNINFMACSYFDYLRTCSIRLKPSLQIMMLVLWVTSVVTVARQIMIFLVKWYFWCSKKFTGLDVIILFVKYKSSIHTLLSWVMVSLQLYFSCFCLFLVSTPPISLLLCFAMLVKFSLIITKITCLKKCFKVLWLFVLSLPQSTG